MSNQFGLTNAAGALIVGALIIGAGYVWHFEFIAISIAVLAPGRSIGYYLSQRLHFVAPFIVGIATVLWGSCLAIGVHEAIQYFEPSTAIKIIFGYGTGAYLSMLSYGLISRSAELSLEAKRRNFLLQGEPVIAFIITSIICANT